MKHHNPDPEQRSSKMWDLFFGSTVTGLVNDLDTRSATVHDISSRLRLKSEKNSNPPRKEDPDDKDDDK